MSMTIVRRSAANPNEKTLPPSELGKTLEKFPPLLQRIYQVRGVHSVDELEYGLSGLHDFRLLRGIESAVELLIKAISDGQRMLIVADFDADGATSCAVAVRGLHLLGARDVRYVVPNRFEFGYGLTPEIVDVAARQSPDLLITVDNGIASLDGVSAARAKGIDVLVTDHHLPGAELPNANAIVNPNQPEDNFPSKALAGVGVMFYLLMACRARMRERDWFTNHDVAEPNLAQLLDLVALGTVADVVPLDRNNRIFVAQGLARMRRQQCCPGIAALAEVARRDLTNLNSMELGFALGPRLNAAGRLDDMSLGIECLLSEDADHARQLAHQLDQLNRERRDIGDQMLEEAQVILSDLKLDSASDLPYGLCLYEPSWHQGVIGILASRIKEQAHRPVIVFANASLDAEDIADDETDSAAEQCLIKGSARSVPGVHIRDVLDAVATAHPGLISKFGGHAMAAGLSLSRANFTAFADAFDSVVRELMTPADLQGQIMSDGELTTDDINCDMAEALRHAGPWGQAFPEPQFDGEFELLQARVVAEKHVKMRLTTTNAKTPIDAIAFFTSMDDWPAKVSRVQIVYKLDVNEYRGQRSVQFIVQHITPLPL